LTADEHVVAEVPQGFSGLFAPEGGLATQDIAEQNDTPQAAVVETPPREENHN
jgi:hypothetical protein